jgi:hypothetical protein
MATAIQNQNPNIVLGKVTDSNSFSPLPPKAEQKQNGMLSFPRG